MGVRPSSSRHPVGGNSSRNPPQDVRCDVALGRHISEERKPHLEIFVAPGADAYARPRREHACTTCREREDRCHIGRRRTALPSSSGPNPSMAKRKRPSRAAGHGADASRMETSAVYMGRRSERNRERRNPGLLYQGAPICGCRQSRSVTQLRTKLNAVTGRHHADAPRRAVALRGRPPTSPSLSGTPPSTHQAPCSPGTDPPVESRRAAA